jgi:hypothetical protein
MAKEFRTAEQLSDLIVSALGVKGPLRATCSPNQARMRIEVSERHVCSWHFSDVREQAGNVCS